jgi:hypothetical protein
MVALGLFEPTPIVTPSQSTAATTPNPVNGQSNAGASGTPAGVTQKLIMRVQSMFVIMAMTTLLNSCSSADAGIEDIGMQRAKASTEARNSSLKKFQEREEEIYAHMRRYGINHDDMAALKLLYEESPSIGHNISHRDMKIPAKKLLNPGENYRIEMDEYILTMKVPEGDPGASWIWPYNNIRAPEIQNELKRGWGGGIGGGINVADLGWYTYGHPSIFGGKYDVSGAYISYRILKPEEEERYSTPEKMLMYSTEWQKGRIKTQTDVEAEARRNPVSIWVPTWLVLKPEQVVVNGRIWIRDGMSDSTGRPNYYYRTILKPGRYLIVVFSLPKYAYSPDPSTYPEPIKQAIARVEEMAPSLRVAKINDDGSPDPFVIERVEPAPLPVREKLPATQ